MPKNKYPLIVAVLAVLLVGVSTALVIKMSLSPAAPAAGTNANTVVNEYSNPNPDNIPEPTEATVSWIPGGQSWNNHDFAAMFGIDEPLRTKESNDNTTYNKVGVINDGRYAGDSLYIANVNADMETMYQPFNAMIIADHGRAVIVKRYSAVSTDSSLPPIIKTAAIDNDLSISGLAAPDQITIGSTPYTAKRTSDITGFPDSNNTIPTIGQTSTGIKIYAPVYSTLAQNYSRERNDMTLRMGNGEYISYALQIPFYGEGRVPSVTWADGKANTVDYMNSTVGGCGGSSFPNVAESVSLNDLKAAGKTSNGETVYVYKNSNNDDLKGLYDIWMTWPSPSPAKPSYASFIEMRPYFFWQDPLGRMIKWSRPDIGTGAECGKPVVYLYPTQTEKVSVKLGSNIEVTKSEPEYKNGWTVTAQPNGKLTTADGKDYPYLYWDGNGASYETPKEGFVIASRAVPVVLRQKLLELGLNDQEIKDFSEFWIPKLVTSPFVLISFVPQDEWSKAAPLAISPAPDTLIRVFMDWKPLSAPIEIPEQKLSPTPTRTGFTAVEWGGLLYK